MTVTTPRIARVLFYGLLSIVLALILLGLMTKVVPGKTGVTISRNSEAFLTILIVSLWIDVARPRLLGRRDEWIITSATAGLLLIGGVVLRQMPWPSRVVTLNEALIGLSVLVVYLQLDRPARRWVLLVPVAALVIPVISSSNQLTTDMAEAFGAWVLIPLVTDVLDRPLLRGELPVVVRNVIYAAGLMLFIWVVHLITPKPPEGLVAETTYYIQRATEMFVAAAALLLYYASRRVVSTTTTAAQPGGRSEISGRSDVPR